MPSLQFVITDRMSLISPLNLNDRSIPLNSIAKVYYKKWKTISADTLVLKIFKYIIYLVTLLFSMTTSPHLQMPEYDYSLGKMAGLGEMPGISNVIRRSVKTVSKDYVSTV